MVEMPPRWVLTETEMKEHRSLLRVEGQKNENALQCMRDGWYS